MVSSQKAGSSEIPGRKRKKSWTPQSVKKFQILSICCACGQSRLNRWF